MGRYVRLTLAARFWRKVDRSGECWEWRGAQVLAGYGYFGISHGIPSHAHRVAWVLTYGAIPRGLFVCHRCDNRLCVRPTHLFLGDALTNMRDMDAKGRRRSVVTRAKLSRADVEAIRASYRWGDGGTLAKVYGVNSSTISRVVNEKRWR
jgi:hypothetical protein